LSLAVKAGLLAQPHCVLVELWKGRVRGRSEGMEGIGAFLGIALDVAYCAEAMESITGQRQRHSPSIGIRVVGIEVCRWFREVKWKLQFSRFWRSLALVTCMNQQRSRMNCMLLVWQGRS
jgi:hypothetical protein